LDVNTIVRKKKKERNGHTHKAISIIKLDESAVFSIWRTTHEHLTTYLYHFINLDEEKTTKHEQCNLLLFRRTWYPL